MSLKEGFKKVGKVLNIVRWVAVIGILLAIGIGVMTGNTDSQKQAYIDTVKFMELNNGNISGIVNEIIYTNSSFDGYPEWEIEGKTDQGKVVTASGGGITIKIFTQENGDYIQVEPRNIIIDYGNRQETLAQMYLNKLAEEIKW